MLHYIYGMLQRLSAMAYVADNSINFRAVARELVAVNQSTAIDKSSTSSRSDGTELIPAEAAARLSREGNEFLSSPDTLGAIVDQEGLTNTYAVIPSMYLATFPYPEQARRYALQAAFAMLFVTTLIFTAFAVS
jgi:hypothetical protein